MIEILTILLIIVDAEVRTLFTGGQTPVAYHPTLSLLTPIGANKELLAEISAVTGVEIQYPESTQNANIANKMSSISRQQVDRVINVACLPLGTLDIHMSSSHSRGRKAFLRLEIVLHEKAADKPVLA